MKLKKGTRESAFFVTLKHFKHFKWDNLMVRIGHPYVKVLLENKETTEVVTRIETHMPEESDARLFA